MLGGPVHVAVDAGDHLAVAVAHDLGDGQVTQLRVALGKFKQQIGRLRRQKSEIERAIVELSRAGKAVETMLAARGQAAT